MPPPGYANVTIERRVADQADHCIRLLGLKISRSDFVEQALDFYFSKKCPEVQASG